MEILSLRGLVPHKVREEMLNDRSIIAVLLFGSAARNEHHRDIDLCLVLDKKYPNIEMSRKRAHYAGSLPDTYDVHIFQQLPLYIRQRILKEGKILLCKNEPLLYDIAFAAIKEFNLFEKGYRAYINKVLNG